MITLDNAKTAIDVVARTLNMVKKASGHVTTSSVSDLTKLTRVEPTVIVSADCMNLEYGPALQQSVLSLFCAHYMMALDILGNVDNVEAIKILDKLNPNRDHTGWLVMDETKSRNESRFTYSLPLAGQTLRLEAHTEHGERRVRLEAAVATGDSKLSLQDNVNLSVGRVLDVNISTRNENGLECKTSLKVQVRLMASSLPDNVIMSQLGASGVERGWGDRFHAWRSGRLDFIRDICLAQDMIDEKMRNAVNDRDGKTNEIYQRVATNKKFGLLTNNPSLNTASNIYIISDELAKQIEYKIGGKLSNYSTRQKLFDGSYAMLIVVVDREKGRCNFYMRSQPDYASVSRKEIEAAAKGGKGPDVMEIFQALKSSSFSNF